MYIKALNRHLFLSLLFLPLTYHKTAFALREPVDLNPYRVEDSSEDHDILLGRLKKGTSRSERIGPSAKELGYSLRCLADMALQHFGVWYRTMCDKTGTW